MTQQEQEQVTQTEELADINWAKDVLIGKEEGDQHHAYWLLGYLSIRGATPDVRAAAGSGLA